jgi:hypothetical protein
MISTGELFNDPNYLSEMSNYMKGILIFVAIILVGFFFMVASLLVFHTYLASRNLTTWEFLSWMKVSYMKVWPKKYGSPFSRGSKRENFKLFCFTKWDK